MSANASEATVQMTRKDIADAWELACRNGTTEAWKDIALQWMDGALGKITDLYMDQTKLSAELASLRARCDAAEKDAARYRWIREHVTDNLTPNSLRGEHSLEHKTQYVLPKLIAWADFCGPITFDEAVDMALTAERAKEGETRK